MHKNDLLKRISEFQTNRQAKVTHEKEWRAFRIWANTARVADINRRLRELVKKNPIACSLWEEYRDRVTRGSYRRPSFWDGNHGICIDSVGSGMAHDYFGLYKFENETDAMSWTGLESPLWPNARQVACA
jgi:hypothetical protein